MNELLSQCPDVWKVQHVSSSVCTALGRISKFRPTWPQWTLKGAQRSRLFLSKWSEQLTALIRTSWFYLSILFQLGFKLNHTKLKFCKSKTVKSQQLLCDSVYYLLVSVTGWIRVFPKACWSPVPEYLWIWPYSESRSLQIYSSWGHYNGLNLIRPVSLSEEEKRHRDKHAVGRWCEDTQGTGHLTTETEIGLMLLEA